MDPPLHPFWRGCGLELFLLLIVVEVGVALSEVSILAFRLDISSSIGHFTYLESTPSQLRVNLELDSNSTQSQT
jgi:hypothetical protein